MFSELIFIVNTKTGIPSVSKAFRIPHLQALMVNVDPDVGDEYLLTDNRGRFYLWNSLTMMIWRFKNQMTPAEVVTMVSQDTYEEKWLTRDLNNGSTADLPSPAPPTNLMYEDGS